MAIMMRNTTADRDVDILHVPRQNDGQPFRFEVIWDKYRAYGNNADDLLDFMIEGYNLLVDEEEKIAARLLFIVRQQVLLQATINNHHDLDVECGVWERAILSGARDVPPVPSEWNSTVPLVLVDFYYHPMGELARPVTPQNVLEPDNIVWLSAEDPYDLLVSLHETGMLTLNEALETVT